MSFFDTSATGMHQRINYTPQTWYPAQKHCGGITKCGKLCHKGINIIILKRDGDKIKAYCRECDEVIENGELSDECHE